MKRRVRPIRIERTPPPTATGDRLRANAGIPVRPTDQELERVTAYINWVLCTPMPLVRQIADKELRFTSREDDQAKLAITVASALVLSVVRSKIDAIENAVTTSLAGH